MEIQRLIGRSLRSVVDLDALGERSIILDCDVLQADGGTRTAAITGAYIALSVARCGKLVKFGTLKSSPIRDFVAATSVGVVGGVPMLDLCYQEDSQAEVDMNVVMTGSGKFVELQATAEKTAFDDAHLAQLMALARARHRRIDRRPEVSRNRMIVYCATSQSRASCASFSWPRRISMCARSPNPFRRRRKPATPSKPTPSRKPSPTANMSMAIFSRMIPACEVDALGGAPGVHSARYAGAMRAATDAANNALLLERLRGVENRTARFVCVIALVRDGKL